MGGPRAAGALATLVCLVPFSFPFSPLTAPFPSQVGIPSRSQTLGGLPFSLCCALLTNARHDTTVSSFEFFFLFFFSFADRSTSHMHPSSSSLSRCPSDMSPCHVTPVTSTPRVTPRPFLTCRIVLAHCVTLLASLCIALGLCHCDGLI